MANAARNTRAAFAHLPFSCRHSKMYELPRKRRRVMIYFTADTHFGHANAIWMCGRPYKSVDDMNEAMIAAWNSRVTGNDTVYIVGDMFFRCEDPESILRRLKGRKRLLLETTMAPGQAGSIFQSIFRAWIPCWRPQTASGPSPSATTRFCHGSTQSGHI